MIYTNTIVDFHWLYRYAWMKAYLEGLYKEDIHYWSTFKSENQRASIAVCEGNMVIPFNHCTSARLEKEQHFREP